MDFEATNIKKIYFKGYERLSLIENAIAHLSEKELADMKITIIGKVRHFFLEKNLDVSKNLDPVKTYWIDLLGSPNNFGSFVNLEIGNIFIVGTLASTFLREINGKTLGTLSSGPSGILRGMGANQEQAKNFLEMLSNDKYMVVIRGSEVELMAYEKILNYL